MNKKIAFIGVAAVTAFGSAAVADIDLSFTDFEAVGANYVQYAPNTLEGTLNAFDGEFVLTEDGLNFTYADDFSILIANADLTDILVQMGGYSNFGADNYFTWTSGGSSAAGTQGGGFIDAGPIDVTGYYVWIGNGYGGGGAGIWTGTVDMIGDVSFVPAPGALALLGLAGLASRRRRN